MPTIIENTQQVNALNEIEEALGIIRSINSILSAKDGALSIIYKPEKGRKIVVNLPEASKGKTVAILCGFKDRLVKDVKTKASKHRIHLDEADMACMGDLVTPADDAPEDNESLAGSGEEESFAEKGVDADAADDGEFSSPDDEAAEEQPASDTDNLNGEGELFP